MATRKPVKKKVVKKTQEDKYIELQKMMIDLLGLQEGDVVEIITSVEENENGSYSCETDNVGETATINNIEENYITLSDGCAYPVYALRKNSNSFRLNDDYTAIVEDDGSVTVGCTTIEFDLLERIYHAAQANNESYNDDF